MLGPWETQGKREGLEVWYIRKDIVHQTVVLGVKYEGLEPEEVRVDLNLIKSMEDAYKYVIANAYKRL